MLPRNGCTHGLMAKDMMMIAVTTLPCLEVFNFYLSIVLKNLSAYLVMIFCKMLSGRRCTCKTAVSHWEDVN